MHRAIPGFAVVVVVVGVTAAWQARERADLADRAAISAAEALTIATGAVPGGRVTESELEEENGRLIYSFDIEQADGSVMDVEVDAMTGELLQAVMDTDDDSDDHDDDDDAHHDEREG